MAAAFLPLSSVPDSSSPCGRFAPTPSGPLHFGSLVAAVASYLSAKTACGKWLVRIEDVDHHRTVPGASDHILRTLERLGFTWDGEVVFQSRRSQIYRSVLDELARRGATYGCSCSRKEIGEGLGAGVDGAPIYPGTCRAAARSEPRAVRFRVQGRRVSFEDRLLGLLEQDVERDVGDFVVLRADGAYAYHLAVVVDDFLQGVTEVVRGSDLVDSTARQILIHEALGWPLPSYLHIPVVTNAQGEKLSKQTRAPAISGVSDELWKALAFLGVEPPVGIRGAPGSEILAWALAHWSLSSVPRVRGIPVE